ncbi:hypothetical protein EN868_03115 [Mesorhizobium sp. M2D.F.Ca.ET.225.01.1.1]|uniref:hypothetical protein n=1 Tax=unclassified Mesorhizobium TaxID=325217 RepID=UPI000FD20B25|nr:MULTISPECIES: hypothetical protein [unclassified Mesorhizobium]TGP65454.1 hypothetical protein EN869_003120 [Mesorhizobium sp. M2D.F.Ca.ET.226.01.1.1]TGP71933.1 hypothetical protein EN868_03115 [Mesorhizobium sp. M2D.F.Ca.ET.225.01.1.1]
MTTIRWPDDVLRSQNISFDLDSRSLAGPASVSGATQVISSDSGLWKATFGGVIVKSRQAVLAHRAIAALLEGRLGSILIPLCRGYGPSSGAVLSEDEKALFAQVPHGDHSFFDDGTGYVGSLTNVVLAADAAVRATTLHVTVNYAADDIQPGMHFSLGERLYRIRTYDATTGAMTIRPPLREAVTAGDILNFDDPCCRMRLMNDDGMDLQLALRRFGNPTVQFIEDV